MARERDTDATESKFITLVLPVLVGIIFLAGFVGIVWYAIQKGQGDATYQETVPKIRAESESFKARPDNPGGMEVPHQDKLVLHRTEESDELVRDVEDDGEAVAVVEVTNNSLEVLDVVDADQETTLELAVDDENAAEQEDETTDKDTEKNIVEDVVEDMDEDLKPVTKATTTQGQKVAATTPGGPVYRIQLLSGRSKPAAERARKKFASESIFSREPVYVQEADLGDKGIYYRVQVGNFLTSEMAKDVCAKYKATGKSCFVVKVNP